MRRYLILLSLGFLCSNWAFSQVKTHFNLPKEKTFDKVDLSFTLPKGTCYLAPKADADPVSILSNENIENYVHSFEKKIRDRVCVTTIDLEGKSDDGYGESISYRLFKNSGDEGNQVWKIYLTNDIPYKLDLNYGIGDAFIDLSGLSVTNLKIKTGSANLNVGFISEVANQVDMDNFNVKVDLGSVNFRKMYLSNAKEVNASVGFGNLFFDYSQAPKVKSEIKASVGAGDLIVIVPSKQIPIIVKVKSSMLCRTKIGADFKEIRENVYVNEAYHPDASDLMTFNVDVSMGNIIFKSK